MPPAGSFPVEPVLKDGLWKIQEAGSLQVPANLPTPTSFRQYCLSLPLWEQELLIGIKSARTAAALVNALNSATSILYACDGSVVGRTGTYGWIVSLKDQFKILRCNGPAPGWRPGSFRAEGYGLLSLTIMISHLEKFTGRTIQLPITVFIDSKALIIRMLCHQRNTWSNPHSCLLSDWDITNEIGVCQQARPQWMHLRWIRTHQDNDQPYATLSFPAQLNVDADHLAGEFHASAEERPVVLRPSHTSLSFSILGHSVTSKAKSQLRFAYSSTATFLHMHQLFNWPVGTELEVDWEAHSTLRNFFQEQKLAFTKHVFKIAPTGHITHRNNPSLRSKKCVCCSSPVEDNDHVLLCSALPCHLWRSSLRQKTVHATRQPNG